MQIHVLEFEHNVLDVSYLPKLIFLMKTEAKLTLNLFNVLK